MAPRPGQTADVPGVLQYGGGASGDARESHLRCPGGRETYSITVDHVAGAEQPARMLAAAGVWPAPAYDITTVAHQGLADRGDRPARNDPGIAAVDLFGRLVRYESAPDRRGGTDKSAPPCRPVERRHRLNGAIERQGRHFEPAQIRGQPHTEQPRVRERAHDRWGQPAITLGFVGMTLDDTSNPMDGVKELGGFV